MGLSGAQRILLQNKQLSFNDLILLDLDDDGTQSGAGTYTPDFTSGGPIKKIVNGGAFTLAPPNVDSDTMISGTVYVVNNASAGAITTSGFDGVTGDSFDTTNTNVFECRIRVYDVGGTEKSYLDVVAGQ